MIVTITFSIFLYISILLTVIASLMFPQLEEMLKSFLSVPSPLPELFTHKFFLFILSNNTRHFWNPLNMIVWIPMLGTFLLGVALALNAVIGMIATIAGINMVFYFRW